MLDVNKKTFGSLFKRTDKEEKKKKKKEWQLQRFLCYTQTQNAQRGFSKNFQRSPWHGFEYTKFKNSFSIILFPGLKWWSL